MVRATFDLLRGKLNKNTRGQLDKVWIVVDEDGNYVKDLPNRKLVEDMDELHKKLLHRNKRHLLQEKDTPSTKGNLVDSLKWDGTGEL